MSVVEADVSIGLLTVFCGLVGTAFGGWLGWLEALCAGLIHEFVSKETRATAPTKPSGNVPPEVYKPSM